MRNQALSSVLVPDLQHAFFLMRNTECLSPSMHQNPGKLSKEGKTGMAAGVQIEKVKV